MSAFQCPCRDHFTLDERGFYEICPICFWEDSGQDLDRMDESSGNNSGLTLRQA
ncbi:CPCC family cysteine-rich protein [Paludisphaera soli]|uniref:CPCC family cysteine-rich protein n=1 Tax=Paludisphaera soli TaxID=2712865 RepID=UPI001F0E1360|nr:CPCC family cysteine-rich protein [Paludisphaera soli]